MANGIARSLEKIKHVGQHGGNKIVTSKLPPIEVYRQIWSKGAALGKIVIIDSVQEGDAADIRCGIIVSTDDGQMIRIPMTKQYALNFSRAVLEAVT